MKKIKILMTMLFLFLVTNLVFGQTSRYTIVIRDANGNPKTGLNVDLYHAGGSKAYDLTEDVTNPGQYYHAAVVYGQYDLYVGGVVKRTNIWIGTEFIKTVMDNFNSSGELQTAGIGDDAVTSDKIDNTNTLHLGASALTDTAVWARSSDDIAVGGTSEYGSGVKGVSTYSAGLYGYTNFGYAAYLFQYGSLSADLSKPTLYLSRNMTLNGYSITKPIIEFDIPTGQLGTGFIDASLNSVSMFTVDSSKLHMKGDIVCYGDTVMIVDATGADTLFICDDGDTSRIWSNNNPIKVGNNSLIIKTNGDAVIDGNLNVSGTTTHYGEMYIADNTNTATINATNEWQALVSYISSGYTNGFTYAAGSNGSITAVADAGGGDVDITSAAHGLSGGDIITINGTTSYNGIYSVLSVVDVNTFTITAAYVASETGYWQKGASLTCDTGAGGKYIAVWQSSGISSSVGQVFDFSLCVNTSISTKTTSRRKFSNTDYGSFGGTGIINISDGDIITFILRNTTSNDDVTIRTLDLHISKL